MGQQRPQFDYSPEVMARAERIKMLLLDVDGVLTDGKLYFGNSGEEMKAFHTLDGHGIKMLQKTGVKVGIITGRTSELLQRRARDLGISILIQGREDKFVAMQEIQQQHPVAAEEIAYMGDDYPDLLVMTRVGLATTVVNALPAITANCHWQSERPGGEGAVRELCDLIMLAQGNFYSALEQYTGDR